MGSELGSFSLIFSPSMTEDEVRFGQLLLGFLPGSAGDSQKGGTTVTSAVQWRRRQDWSLLRALNHFSVLFIFHLSREWVLFLEPH